MSNYSANALALGIPYYDSSSKTQQTPQTATTASNYSAAPAAVNPSYMSSLFPNGVPQVQANGISGANAAGGAPIDASQYGSSAMTNEILNALSPVFAQQQRALTDNLANAGIVGGSTAGAEQDLANNQITQALGQLAPIQQTANGQMLGAQEFTSGQQQQNNQFNASADQGAQTFNAEAANTANNTNVGNTLNAATTDVATRNNLLAQILNYTNSNYQQQMQDQYGLATGAAGGQQSAFVPVYQQPSNGVLGDITSGLGSYLGKAAAAAPAAA